MISLLLGVAIAATIFAAFLATLYQVVTQKGIGRWFAATAIMLTILTMATISWEMVGLSQLVGGILIIVSIFTAWYVSGLDRLWPVVLVCFGIAALLGIPFKM